MTLAALIALILVAKYWEEAQIAAIRRDSRSLFDDRLIPETLLLQAVDTLHQRRARLQLALTRPPDDRDRGLSYELGRHAGKLDELLLQFERTYLVDDEVRGLAELRSALARYTTTEKTLVAKGPSAARDRDLDAEFEGVRGALLRLSAVQQSVGAMLEAESATLAGRVTTLLYFQLGVAFVLGLVASAAAIGLTGPGVPPSPERPRSHPPLPRAPGNRPTLRAVKGYEADQDGS